MLRSKCFLAWRTARRLLLGLVLASLASILVPSIGRAQLTITPAGAAQGLSLTTFATGFPNSSSVGPLGIAFPTSGGVLVSDYPGNVRLFPTDSDGQNAASVTVGQNFGAANAKAITIIGGNIYMNQSASGDIVQLNGNGTLNQTIVTGLPSTDDLLADPSNGDLFVSGFNANEVYIVDPLAKTVTPFASVSVPDGLALSGDGSTLYVAATGTGHLLGFNTTTGAEVFDSGALSGGIDGTAVGAGPIFGDYIFANFNNGTLLEINETTLAQTVIANGGSRGDFVTVDPSNDTLLITQTDRIMRLNGAAFAIPEPGTGMLAGVALSAAAAAGLMRRIRGQRARRTR